MMRSKRGEGKRKVEEGEGVRGEKLLAQLPSSFISDCRLINWTRFAYSLYVLIVPEYEDKDHQLIKRGQLFPLIAPFSSIYQPLIQQHPLNTQSGVISITSNMSYPWRRSCSDRKRERGLSISLSLSLPLLRSLVAMSLGRRTCDLTEFLQSEQGK